MQILTSTPYFHVLYKPAEVNFHTENDEIGFVVQAEAFLNEKLYPVHRLDKVTSGILLLARSSEVAKDLSVLFTHKEIEKYYLALSDKKPKKKQGAVVGDMQKGRRGSWMLAHTMDNPARTQFFSFGNEKGVRLFVVRPRTGKTHQIRVALKSLGAPIIGDSLYHGPCTTAFVPDRTYLHAYALRFSLYGTDYSYLCMPQSGIYWEDFSSWSVELERPWELPWPK